MILTGVLWGTHRGTYALALRCAPRRLRRLRCARRPGAAVGVGVGVSVTGGLLRRLRPRGKPASAERGVRRF
jgi:hypothetical protein